MIPEAAVNEETIKQVREVSDAIHKIGQAFGKLTIPEGSKLMRGRQVIPEAAVEAAAKAVAIGMWGRYDPDDVPYYLNAVREILEAAAPHMLAQFVMEAEQQRMISDYERPAK